jgi:hypothetical protein
MPVVPTVRFSQQRVQNHDGQRQQHVIEKCTFGYHSPPPLGEVSCFLIEESAKQVPTSGIRLEIGLSLIASNCRWLA